MARTAEGEALSAQHRQAQLVLRAELLREMTQLWPLFDPVDFTTFDRFAAAASLLIRGRNQQSAALAAQYLELFRQLEGVGGTLTPVLVPPPPESVATRALRATGLLGVLNARRSGFSPQAAARNGFVRVAGTASSLVLAGGRLTLLESLARDPARPRWQRITSGRPCAFCAMLASRGPVYRSEQTGGFQVHDHCSCSVEPAYEGSRMPEASARFRDQWRDATRGLSGDDALNAFRRSIEGREEDVDAAHRAA